MSYNANITQFSIKLAIFVTPSHLKKEKVC